MLQKNGTTRCVKLGEARITSHIYSNYQNIIIKLEDCDIEINPHWHDGNRNERTTIEMTPKKGFPMVYPFDKYHMADKRIFIYMYKDKKGRTAWKNRMEGRQPKETEKERADREFIDNLPDVKRRK